jgi:hypothetical protein
MPLAFLSSRTTAALAVVAVMMAGCSGRPGRVATPAVDPDDAAEQAIEEFDRNGDAALSKEELAACPSLLDALPAYDTSRDGALTGEEVAAGIDAWSQRAVGAISLPFVVRLDGRPLADAQIRLIPAAFLGDAVKPALGVADAAGAGALNMAPEDRPANIPKGLPMIQPGLYTVQITHPTAQIPAKYNVQSGLGLEAAVAGQNPAGVTWNLTSK